MSLRLTLRLPPQGASSPSWSRFTLDTLEELTLTGNGLLNLGRTTNPVGCAAVSAVENGTDTIADVLPSSDLFQATMPSQLDSMGQSQESFNLMFQTMPYEVSEPVMCKPFSPDFPDDDKGISPKAKPVSVGSSFFRSMRVPPPKYPKPTLYAFCQGRHNS